MIKLLGSLLVLGGFAAAWAEELNRWRRERETLAQLIGALGALSDRIRLTRLPLPRILRELGEARAGAVGAWLTETAAALEGGAALKNAWETSCKYLPVEDKIQKIVGELGYKLSGDEMEICEGISLVTDWLNRELVERNRKKQDWTRQAGAICFSGAALLIILLL